MLPRWKQSTRTAGGARARAARLCATDAARGGALLVALLLASSVSSSSAAAARVPGPAASAAAAAAASPRGGARWIVPPASVVTLAHTLATSQASPIPIGPPVKCWPAKDRPRGVKPCPPKRGNAVDAPLRQAFPSRRLKFWVCPQGADGYPVVGHCIRDSWERP